MSRETDRFVSFLQERPTYGSFEVKDCATWATPTPDYKADAEEMFTRFEKEVAAAEGKEPEKKAEPDSLLDMADTGWVVL